MKIRDVAVARRWSVPNAAPSGGEVTLAGWDFGGSGPLALLHHANGMCAATWGLVATALTEHFRVIAIDARGHGDSQRLTVPDDYAWNYFVSDLIGVVECLQDEFGTDQLGLGLGNSFGGIVTAAAQARAPTLFERVVMLDPPIHPTKDVVGDLELDIPPQEEHGELLAELARRRTALWPSRTLVRDKWVNKPLFANWQAEAFGLYVEEGFQDRDDGQIQLKCDPLVEAHVFATTGSLGPLEYAPHVQVPVSVVRAAEGNMSEPILRAVAERFPYGEYQELSGGHLLPLENPGVVVEHVFKFFGAR